MRPGLALGAAAASMQISASNPAQSSISAQHVAASRHEFARRGGRPPCQDACATSGPSAVVAAVRIAERRHQDLAALAVVARHERRTVSFRKCVEHEMQGSKLRIVCSQRCADDVVRLVQHRCRDGREIGLDARLVLRGRRHDARRLDRPVRRRTRSGASRCRAAPRCSRSRRRRAAQARTDAARGGSYSAMMRSASSKA